MSPVPHLKIQKNKTEVPSVDLSGKVEAITPKPHPWRRVMLVFVVALVIFGGIFAYKVYRTGNKVLSGTNASLLSQLSTLFTNPDKPLRGEQEGRVNVLLLGLGGPGHEGAFLTDTMIVASFNTQTKEVAMLSLPRDLYVNIPNYGFRKINNAFAFGHEKQAVGGGEELSVATVQETIDIPIHYYTWVDFKGFEKLIDDIGGVTVTVDQSFVDYQYPTSNYGYQTVKFTEGTQTMDGKRALMFVRSRHGTNGEGSDFARSRRQQKILLAVKQKLSGFGTLANPSRVSSVLDNLSSHMRTNMQVWELLKLSKLFDGVTKDDIAMRTLDTSPSGLLKNDYTADGAYILKPKSGSFNGIQYLAQHIFDYAAIAKEQAEVVLINATKDKQFGSDMVDELASMNYTITQQVSFANARTSSVIYDLSQGAKPETLKDLKTRIGNNVQTVLPQDIEKSLGKNSTPDFIILMGTDVLPKEVQGGPVAVIGPSRTQL